MSGKFEIYLEGGWVGEKGHSVTTGPRRMRLASGSNIFVAKAQIAHATQLEHIFVATSRATVDAPARRRSYIESTDHSESACRKTSELTCEECELSLLKTVNHARQHYVETP